MVSGAIQPTAVDGDRKDPDAVEIPVSKSAVAIGVAQSGSRRQQERDDEKKTDAVELPVSGSAAAKIPV
jgi:hypothetical protein